MINLASLLFYIFAAVSVASAVMVISSRNPVHSVLFLILIFFNVAGLFVLIGAEFLAFLLIMVYVGAISVLFLFVVMMLNIDVVKLREGFLQYLPVGLFVGATLLLELLLVFNNDILGVKRLPQSLIEPNITNVEAIGRVLYTDYFLYFQMAGAILLVAMIGAITLTLYKYNNPKKQSIVAQNARNKAASIEIVKVKSGTGL